VPISSFYGLETSLRGLLAQQRSLDTTGHNIANASTAGYSRQEAVLSASAALQIPAGGVADGASAHVGSGVDVQGYRRVRDQFLDLQYRGQSTNLGEWSARSSALDRAEGALAEPGDNGVNAQLSKFWDAWSNLAKAPNDLAAKQALVQRGAALADALGTVRGQMQEVAGESRAEYADLARPASGMDPGGEVAQTATELAQLNDTIARYLTAGDPPNDLMDRRDLLLDKLSTFGQISVEALPSGSMKVSFVDSATPGATYPVVDDKTAVWSGPPAGDAWSPGGRLGGLLTVARQPGGTIDGYLGSLDDLATNIHDMVNGAYGGSFFTVGSPAGATLDVDPSIVADPSKIQTGVAGGGSGSGKIAIDVAALRGNAAIDQRYASFVAQVGTQVQDATRQQGNASALTDAVDDRRQSVAGVSMDEEMSNLVRFQRAYQASSRAMSTMDDMLEVLINRTGRVGL
jgi:flagellar hook-associated protein 1